MRIVLDTNVLISALLSEGPPARILNLIRSRQCVVLVDERILEEYEEVLLRPKFGFAESIVRPIVEFFTHQGERVTAPPLPIKIPDPDDLPFLEVAVAGKADLLITGNKGDYAGAPRKPKIISPTEALREFSKMDAGFIQKV